MFPSIICFQAPNPASKEIKRKYQLGRHLITLASKPNLRTDVLNKYLKDFKLAQEKEKNSSGVDVSNEQEHVNCEQTEE